MTALDEIITRREAECDDIEYQIDMLDDKLYDKYVELEYFKEKKRSQIQTTFDGCDV